VRCRANISSFADWIAALIHLCTRHANALTKKSKPISFVVEFQIQNLHTFDATIFSCWVVWNVYLSCLCRRRKHEWLAYRRKLGVVKARFSGADNKRCRQSCVNTEPLLTGGAGQQPRPGDCPALVDDPLNGHSAPTVYRLLTDRSVRYVHAVYFPIWDAPTIGARVKWMIYRSVAMLWTARLASVVSVCLSMCVMQVLSVFRSVMSLCHSRDRAADKPYPLHGDEVATPFCPLAQQHKTLHLSNCNFNVVSRKNINFSTKVKILRKTSKRKNRQNVGLHYRRLKYKWIHSEIYDI